MNWRTFAVLLAGFSLAAWTLADIAEARGGGGGGGHFSRGGGGGHSGSIRNSSRPSTRPISRPSTRPISRPSQGVKRPAQDRQPSEQRHRVQGGAVIVDFGSEQQQVRDRTAKMSPERQPQIKDRVANESSERQQQIKDRAVDMTPEQKQKIKERRADLSPESKEQFREKWENSGLKPEDLPDRDEIREDWQDWRDESREDWQDWYDDRYGDYWDDRWRTIWWYGNPVSTVPYSFYIDDTPPCQETIVINKITGTTTYYYCDAIWYQPVYTSGEVMYVVAAPPPDAELSTLTDPYKVTVSGQDYFVSNHIFYREITRDGQVLYVSVFAPRGARVPTIPPYAVEIKARGEIFYRFDNIFYVRKEDGFMVTGNPGV
jgi:hypothetical protein